MKPRTPIVHPHRPDAGPLRPPRWARSFYLLALRAFPREFRARFGNELLQVFGRDLEAGRRAGPGRAAATAIRACADAVRQGIAERLQGGGRDRPTPSRGPARHSPRPPRGPDLMIDSLLQDIRFAFRTLGRNRVFSVIVIGTLALGLGAVAVVFSAVKSIVLDPLPYPRAHELVALWQPSAEDPEASGAVSPVDLQDWRTMDRSFAALGGLRSWRPTLTGVETPESLSAYRLSLDVLRALEVEPHLGRLFEPSEDGNPDARVALLAHAAWLRLFGGDPGVVGTSIRLDDEGWQVVGILPPSFEVPFAEDAALVGPYDIDASAYSRGSRFLRAVGRLAPGVGLEEARADMARVAAALAEQHPDTNRDILARVVPLHAEVLEGVDRQLWLLLGAVGFVLLITVVNVANLAIARAASRQGELAVRSALGAGQGRLGRQILTEALLLAAAGGLAGLVAAQLTLGALLRIVPDGVPRTSDVDIDLVAVAVTAVLTLGAGVVFGIVPAVARGGDTADVLRSGRGRLGAPGQRARRALVVVQIAVALVLLIGSGLLINSLARLLGEDPGFDPAGAYAARVRLGSRYSTPGVQARYFEDLADRLERHPGIVETTSAFLPPFSGGGIWGSFDVVGAPEPEPGLEPSASVHSMRPGFVEMMGVRVLAGRSFGPADDPTGEPVAMVNEAAARQFWPDSSPVGSVVQLRVSVDDQERDAPRRVVGILADVHHRRLDESPQPFLFVPAGQWPTRSMYLLVRPADPTTAIAPLLRSVMDEIDPDVAIQTVRRVDEMIGATVASDRFAATLLSGFAVAALILGCVGIYGVVAYGVAERTGEFGVRMALGARGRDIGRMVVRDTAILALLGLALGIGGALLLGGALAEMLHEIDATDPATFGAMSALLFAAALLACALPARRATRVDPLSSLRAD